MFNFNKNSGFFLIFLKRFLFCAKKNLIFVVENIRWKNFLEIMEIKVLV
jgi:hypothetical protein